jgi:predicted amidohydrolase
MLAVGDDQLPMADVTLAAANVRIAGALFFGAGEQTPVFDTPVARVVSLICHDLAFPSSCGFSRCAAPRSR